MEQVFALNIFFLISHFVLKHLEDELTLHVVRVEVFFCEFFGV
jgi:hypothetical protein